MIRKLAFCIFLIFPVFFNSKAQEVRSFDGSDNNIANPNWGAANTLMNRLTTMRYGGNGYSDPGGEDRPNARMVSNTISAQDNFIENSHNLSDFFWGFGQFIDHDITFNLDTTSEFMSIEIPMGDEFFDPDSTGAQQMMMRRGAFDRSTGTSMNNPREQLNSISGFIDGSAIYGSDEARATWLRLGTDGKLKTSEGNLPPYNTTTGNFDDPIDPSAPLMIIEGHPRPEKYFVCGDVRANEQPGLTSFHTLFLREHNRQCDFLKTINPNWDDEKLFQEARRRVGALMQVVLYEEWLPAFGINLPSYTGYNSTVNPTIMSIFSSAAFRIGHTLVNEQILRLDDTGDLLSFGSIHIKEAFFKPEILKDEGGIEPFFRGMATQAQQEFDNKVVGTLRNFLFGLPGQGGLDLVAMNIERSRERGIADFNTIREDFGLSPYTDFSEINQDTTLTNDLQSAYVNVSSIDPWIGMVSEEPFGNSIAGETMTTIIAEQFRRLRDGDRFYYENDPAFSPLEISQLKSTRLSSIILRNTNIERIQQDVFHTDSQFLTVGILPFEHIRKIELIAYPNPTPDNFQLKVKTLVDDEANVSILDQTGRIIYSQVISLRSGENEFQFSLNRQLSPGMYIVTLRTSNDSGQLRLVKSN